MACPGCYNYFGDTVAPTADLLNFVSEYARHFGLRKITVGGGDPLTRTDIVTLLRGIKGLGLKINLDTVGTNIVADAEIRFMGKGTVAKVNPEDLVESVDLLGIPIDGSTTEKARLFRRFYDLPHQMRVLEALSRAGARVCINTVAHIGNLDDLANIARIVADQACVVEWQIFQFMPIGPLGFRNRERYNVTTSQYEQAVAPLEVLLSESGINLKAKSASGRKNRYLLIDSDGQAWIPRQNDDEGWTMEDQNGERRIICNISDANAIEALQREFATSDSNDRASQVSRL